MRSTKKTVSLFQSHV